MLDFNIGSYFYIIICNYLVYFHKYSPIEVVEEMAGTELSYDWQP